MTPYSAVSVPLTFLIIGLAAVFDDGVAQTPKRAQGTRDPAVVVMSCSEALASAAEINGAARVEVELGGPIRMRSDGGVIALLLVGVQYLGEGRTAQVECQLSSAGYVEGLR